MKRQVDEEVAGTGAVRGVDRYAVGTDFESAEQSNLDLRGVAQSTIRQGEPAQYRADGEFPTVPPVHGVDVSPTVARELSKLCSDIVMTTRRFLLLCLALAIASPAAAQPLCELPVSAYLAAADGTPLDGATDLELRFYTDAALDSPAVECRSFAAVSVDSGWARVSVDACGTPSVEDCGAVALNTLFADALGLWVGVWVDGTELGPRIPVGAVPFAVQAGDAQALQGSGPEAFEPAGALEAHAADGDAHHSSTSDGVDITPRSVRLGDTELVPGRVDLGPDANDELTASIVTVLTGGGEADALHTHAGDGAGGSCYTGYGVSECAEGWTLIYPGYQLESLTYEQDTDGGSYDSGTAAVSTFCVAETAVDTFAGGAPMPRSFVSIGDNEVAVTTGPLRCALCCR